MSKPWFELWMSFWRLVPLMLWWLLWDIQIVPTMHNSSVGVLVPSACALHSKNTTTSFFVGCCFCFAAVGVNDYEKQDVRKLKKERKMRDPKPPRRVHYQNKPSIWPANWDIRFDFDHPKYHINPVLTRISTPTSLAIDPCVIWRPIVPLLKVLSKEGMTLKVKSPVNMNFIPAPSKGCQINPKGWLIDTP